MEKVKKQRKERVRQYKHTLLYGLGLNDADYKISWIDRDGKWNKCPAYTCWVQVLKASCDDKYYSRGRTICEEWKLFSNFAQWYWAAHARAVKIYSDLQHDECIRLTTDISGHYSPTTAFFTSSAIIGLTRRKKAILKPGGCMFIKGKLPSYHVFMSNFRHRNYSENRVSARYKGAYHSINEAEVAKRQVYGEQTIEAIAYLSSLGESDEIINMINEKLKLY